jgi:ATP-binding cassette, subfamily B, bacterial MsbA
MIVLLRALRALLPLLRLRPWLVSLMIGLGILAALSEGVSISLFIPLIQNQMGTVDSGLVGKISLLFQRIPADTRLLWIGLSILLCVVLKNILSYTYSLLFLKVNASISHRLRCGVLHQVLSMSQSYLDTHGSGRLLNTLGTDTWRVSSAFTVLTGAIINVCLALTLSLLLLLISWKLTLIAGGLLLLISQVVQLLSRSIKQLSRQATSANANLSQRMLETFHGLRLIRAFGRESHEQNRFEEASLQVSKIFLRMEKVSILVNPLSEIFAASLLLGILLAMTMHTPGQLAASVTFLILLYRLQPRIRQLDADRVALNAFSASVEEVGSFLDKTDKPYLHSGARMPASIEKAVVFENVSFHYGSEENAGLENVSCSIAIGETTALVGPSGAGKSSMISLICRFYDPSSGRVLIDGIPLPQLDLAWWRSQMALVSQDPFLFNASVAENIAYGKLDATREEVLEAARKANALRFIEDLPNGFETVLGDWGLRLSGGQRQRLALARAFIRDPKILILDEATNSLDLISEKVIQDALEEFGRSRTVLIVAHRISTIEHADQVIVLDAGKVVESGSVTQLLSNGGLFSRFYALQLRKTKVGHVRPGPPNQDARPDLVEQKP